MKKLSILAIVLALASVLVAQSMTGAFDWVRTGTSSVKLKQVSTLTSITTVTDTSEVFYFNDLVPYGSIYLKFSKKGAGTALKIPGVDYKYVDENGKFYGTDSANTWIVLSCSSATALAVTSLDTVCRIKVYDFRTVGPAGVVFRTFQPTADSTKTKISVVGAKARRDYTYPPIW